MEVLWSLRLLMFLGKLTSFLVRVPHLVPWELLGSRSSAEKETLSSLQVISRQFRDFCALTRAVCDADLMKRRRCSSSQGSLETTQTFGRLQAFSTTEELRICQEQRWLTGADCENCVFEA